jgi:hypothetical protein
MEESRRGGCRVGVGLDGGVVSWGGGGRGEGGRGVIPANFGLGRKPEAKAASRENIKVFHI